MGLGSDSLLIWGTMGAAAFLLIYAVVLYFLNASLLKKDIYGLSEKEEAVYYRNHKLKRTCAIVLVILLGVTFVGHQFATSIWGPYSIVKGTTFEDYDSFVEYMKQDIPASPRYSFNGRTTAVEIPALSEEIETGTYYDEYGNEISEEKALTRRLEDKNGNVVCEYIDRNESVVSLRYTPKDGTILPITVCTEDVAGSPANRCCPSCDFRSVYCIKCLAVVLIYFKKRAK